MNTCQKGQPVRKVLKTKPEKVNGLDDELFNLFGISIYADDLVIVGLLFLLYKEGIKDQSLFISLVLLLLDR